MKKLFMLFAVFGCSILGYSQDVRVNNINVNISDQNGNTNYQECPYRINGICITEDVGGVDANIIYADNCTWVVFTNYNTFPVTILYEIGSNYKNEWPLSMGTDGNYYGYLVEYETKDGKCGSIVCGIEGSKKVKLHQTYCNHPYEPASGYHDDSQYYSIKGIIARKLSN